MSEFSLDAVLAAKAGTVPQEQQPKAETKENTILSHSPEFDKWAEERKK